MTDRNIIDKLERQRILPFTEPTGEELRDAGMEQAKANEPRDWIEQALMCVRLVARRQPLFTADDIHLEASLLRIGKPHHPNVWGSLFRTAKREKLMVETGMFVKSHRSNQHATRIPQYRSLLYREDRS